jgi:uncharacterized repeat protein (TIGR03803 family)
MGAWCERDWAAYVGAGFAACLATACDQLVGVKDLASATDAGITSEDGTAPEAGDCSPGDCSGTCAMGRCLVTLAMGQWSAVNVTGAVDSSSFYWTGFGPAMSDTGGVVARVGIAGPAFTGPLDSNAVDPSGLAIDAANVYWVDNGAPFSSGTMPTGMGTVMMQPLSGGPATMLAASPTPYGLAVRDGVVYWVDITAGTVMSVPASGTEQATTLASDQTFPQNIAVDARNVYWLNSGAVGSVMQVALTGGTPIPLAQNQSFPNNLVSDGTYVYWTNADGLSGTVMKVPVGGGKNATPLATANNPQSIAVDDSNVYFTVAGEGATGAGSVQSVGLDGGPVTTLAVGQTGPFEIAVDSTSVYWVTWDGNVMKATPK